MRHQNLYTYLNMAAIILVWISTVDDGHMTKPVTIATIHNIGHLEEKNKYVIYTTILDAERRRELLTRMSATKTQISLRIRAV